MAGFFSKFFGSVSSGDGAKVSHIEQYFKPLKVVSSGLPNAIGHFVVDGKGSSVLSTLGTTQTLTAWGNRWQTQGYSYQDLFSKDLKWTFEQGKRLAEVLETVNPPNMHSNYGLPGTDISPYWLRLLFQHPASKGTRVRELEFLVGVAKEGGVGTTNVLDILFAKDFQIYSSHNRVETFTGVKEWLTENSAATLKSAEQLASGQRAELITTVGRFGLSDLYLPLIIDAGIGSLKGPKKAALIAITGATPALLKPTLEERFRAASTNVKVELVGLVMAGLPKEAPEILAAWKENDSQAKVTSAIERAMGNLSLAEQVATEDAGATDHYIALDGSRVELPPLPPLPPPSTISNATFALLDPVIKSYNEHYEAGVKEAKALKKEKGHNYHWTNYAKPIDLLKAQIIKADLQKTKLPDQYYNSEWRTLEMVKDKSGLAAFLASPEVTERHLIALFIQTSYGNILDALSTTNNSMAAVALRKRVAAGADVRNIAKLWSLIRGTDASRALYSGYWLSHLEPVDHPVIFALASDRFELLDEAFGLRPQSTESELSVTRALQVLSTFPKVPQRYLLPLMTIATSGTKIRRLAARQLLADAPKIDANIAELLGDGKQDVRAGAADWLGLRGAKGQVPALRAAIKKERSDVAKAAMISALEQVGDDVSDFFDPSTMKAEAQAGLAKASNKGLEWFPFDYLPRLNWRDGDDVDPVLVKWWVMLSHKLKQPGGNALIDLWFDRLKEGDAHELGLFVLSNWIEHDTRQTSPEEANAHAAREIDARLASNITYAKRNPQYAEYYVTDRDRLFAMIRNEVAKNYLGSAAESKGILALTSRVNGAEAARHCRGFLKNHGSRVSQAKAIIEALASNPSSAAIQVVLATANRFKARTVQAFAGELIEALAERRGWTPEELADRTIPTGGLDEAGLLELDCGVERTYKIVLDETDTVTLVNPAGKKVSTLPSARVDEEKPLIDEAKKLLANARKEIKQVLPDQVARLREAMMLERRWNRDDWQLYVAQHPLVGRLARRLVWIALDGEDKVIKLFRPLDDGSLSDVEDGTFELEGTTSIQLAHSSLVDRATRDAWRDHLEAYEVSAPFDQLGRTLPILDVVQKKETLIGDRKGWAIETFKLRSAATKLNYERGAAEDGGWFTTYERRYSAAGIVAIIEFSGSPLPEENAPAVLRHLSFAKQRKGSSYHGEIIELGDVPPVLLAETWQDLREIADKGTGFDPNWEAISPW